MPAAAEDSAASRRYQRESSRERAELVRPFGGVTRVVDLEAGEPHRDELRQQLGQLVHGSRMCQRGRSTVFDHETHGLDGHEADARYVRGRILADERIERRVV